MAGPEAWGKLERGWSGPGPAPRLSLVAHCIDVAAVLQALLELPTLRIRLARIAGRSLTGLDHSRLCVLAFLHDIGKAGAGFYSKALSPEIQTAWRRAAPADGAQFGHVNVVAPLFNGDGSFASLRDALGMDGVLAWGGADQSPIANVIDLWLASISHHGAPLTVHDLSGHGAWTTWTRPIDGYDPQQGLNGLRLATRALWPEAFSPEAPPFLPVSGAFVHAYAGLVSLADWIGSNTDEGFFPYGLATQDTARWPVACARARDVLRSMRIDIESARADLQCRRPTFEEAFGFSAKAVQVQAAQPGLGPLVTLEAETGSGKTEAALWRFKTLFEAGDVDSLCFLLPTRVAATGIHGRIQTFMSRLFPDAALRPNVVLAVPGYLRANGRDGKPLAGFKVLWPDDVGSGDKPLYWAAENSKRYFAAGAVAATIDQFLLSGLQTKHAHMRASLLLRAFVVVDEVHASDAYMTALLRNALQRHVRWGGHALLMSATLTGEARADLLSAGLPARGLAAQQARAALADAQAPYPCIGSASGLRSAPRDDHVKHVHRRLLPAMRDPAAVADEVAQAVAAGARVLVLRNTVAQAVATQQAIEARLGIGHPALFRVDGAVALHHGRYAFEDRQQLDAAVERVFGKAAHASREARVLVGTQTLEISVDCDADLLITDMAPIDVLLQRLGRLHRHRSRDSHRPAAYTSPRVVVLTPPDRDLKPLLQAGGTRGLGIGRRSAYESLLAIEAAWRALEDHSRYPVLAIPDDNRPLVEAGADSSRLYRLAEELGADWVAHADAIFGKRGAQGAQARPVMLRWDLPWNDSAWTDLGDDVRTRLGLDAIEVELPQPWTTPLHQLVTSLSVPQWMLPGVTAPPAATDAVDGDDALELTVAGRRLRYDRLGLRLA